VELQQRKGGAEMLELIGVCFEILAGLFNLITIIIFGTMKLLFVVIECFLALAGIKVKL
jgi:hypothetical protein